MKGQNEALTLKEAIQLAAPHTWPASVLPSLFGIGYCYLNHYALSPFMAFVVLAICVLMQSGVNTINDFFDYVKGTDSLADCLEESDAVLLYHPVNPRHVLLLGLGFLGIAGVLGLWVVSQSGLAPLWVGLIGAAAVVLYSGGPLPLSYLPVGEMVSGFVMGGLIPTGILAAAAGQVRAEILPWSLPFILGIALIMMANNGCDIDKDRKSGRHTLPALLGRGRAVVLYRITAWIWLVLICVFSWCFAGGWGMLAPAVLLLCGRRAFAQQVMATLLQEKRIAQMKSVLMANVIGNGAYLLVLAVAMLRGKG